MVRAMAQAQTRSQSGADLAVLTGDIVRSSKLAPETLDAAMAGLARGAAAMGRWEGSRDASFDRFRGDGWQCLAPSPAMALRAALFLRAHLRALDREIDTRVSVGIGPGALAPSGDLAAASARPSRSRAAASTAWPEPSSSPSAGRARRRRPRSSARSTRSPTRSRGCGHRAQAEVLIETLSPGDERQKALAAQRGVSQQAIAKRLSAGGDWALQRAMAALEA